MGKWKFTFTCCALDMFPWLCVSLNMTIERQREKVVGGVSKHSPIWQSG